MCKSRFFKAQQTHFLLKHQEGDFTGHVVVQEEKTFSVFEEQRINSDDSLAQ
jgi:hypothetical protein